MDKLKLSKEEIAILKRVIHDAYEDGKSDATFLANSEYELFDGEEVTLARILKKYCEEA